MRLGRISMAVLAGALAVFSWMALFAVQRRFFPQSTDTHVVGWIAFGLGVAALWLAERFDLVAPALTPPVVDLYEKDPPRDALPEGREPSVLEKPREREKVER